MRVTVTTKLVGDVTLKNLVRPRQPNTIDLANRSDRKWLDSHILWSANHGCEVVITPNL